MYVDTNNKYYQLLLPCYDWKDGNLEDLHNLHYISFSCQKNYNFEFIHTENMYCIIYPHAFHLRYCHAVRGIIIIKLKLKFALAKNYILQ